MLGDFNCDFTIEGNKVLEFCDVYNLENVVKEPTCYKNPLNPTHIDVILTNRSKNFQDTTTIETGLSDFHKMTITCLKCYFKKNPPRVVYYRNYKKFDEHRFRNDLHTEIYTNSENNTNYEEIKTKIMKQINKSAPMKKKFIRANNSPFMNKKLHQAIMTRSRYKNRYNKNPTTENEMKYKKQRNICVNLLKKAKRTYYNNLDIKILNDNREFWKNVKPLFTNKQIRLSKAILIENDVTITNDESIAEVFNDFFINTTTNLNLGGDNEANVQENCRHDFNTILETYAHHPSVRKIKEKIKIENEFSFTTTTTTDIMQEINKLDSNKTTAHGDIPVKILKICSDIVSPHLNDIYDNIVKLNEFPNSLKLADVTPAHKKDDTTNKTNYRPVSILPTISKIFERDMFNQIFEYIEQYLSPYLCGFRKHYNTQNCLMVMIEKWKKALDKKEKAGAVLTDLSKAFDSLNHRLLIAKLHAYGFNENSLRLIYNYLTFRKQRTKVNNSFSTWKDIKSGVPQGSILGPLLFNIFINDVFLFLPETEIVNYADDNTPYTINKDATQVITKLESDSENLNDWFRLNFLKSNDDKYKLLLTGSENTTMKIGTETIQNSSSVKLLGITIDNKLNFNEHVIKMCKKASKKIHALGRIAKYMTSDKLKLIMKAFIDSEFGYCPLIWMFHNRTLNNKINHLHERVLRLVYKDHNSSFSQLLAKDNTLSIHGRNLQKLAIEMYKIKNNLSPPIVTDLFTRHTATYNLRRNKTWENTNVRTVTYGTETVLFRGPKIWEIIPDTTKQSSSLSEFKTKIKSWIPSECTCRLCKTFIPNLGFI